jgi:hypothetical protein
LSISRTQSEGLVTNVRKLSPYTMFYRKLYELVLSRLDLLCVRLYGSSSNEFEKMVWNLFLYLFVNYTCQLFRSRDIDQIILTCIYYSANSNLFHSKEELTWARLIQAYKSIPNSKVKILRSVFICQLNSNEHLSIQQQEKQEQFKGNIEY